MLEYDLQYFFYVKRKLRRSDDDVTIMRFDGDVTHEETRLCLGGGDRGEDFYAVNWNAGELVRVGLDESVRNVVGKSHRNFGESKKPLVVLKLFFVENVVT